MHTLLSGKDLRSIAGSCKVVKLVTSQELFDILFNELFSKERVISSRAADAIEKITLLNPEYLFKHKKVILKLLDTAVNKEFQWHLALLVPRLVLTKKELENCVKVLTGWALNKDGSRIVRVNSLQALYDIYKNGKLPRHEIEKLTEWLSSENIPAINARIKKIKL